MNEISQFGSPDMWAKFGLVGLIIFALFALVWFLISENRRANKEFSECVKNMWEKADVRQQETNQVINALTLVIERNTSLCNNALRKA